MDRDDRAGEHRHAAWTVYLAHYQAGTVTDAVRWAAVRSVVVLDEGWLEGMREAVRRDPWGWGERWLKEKKAAKKLQSRGGVGYTPAIGWRVGV